MSEPRTNPQDFQTAQWPKRKQSFPTVPSEATTSFLSPNHFTVLSDSESDIEENEAPSQSDTQQARIPPIVICSYLNNHSLTLKQVNEKLTTQVDVKSKANRLLLYTKSSHDYNILLTEIRAAKLAYQMYPLPAAPASTKGCSTKRPRRGRPRRTGSTRHTDSAYNSYH